MVNNGMKRKELSLALQSQDPNAVAKALQIPPINPSKREQEPKIHSVQSLTVDDIDYSSLLTNLLNASEAAESVSVSLLPFKILRMILLFQYITHRVLLLYSV